MIVALCSGEGRTFEAVARVLGEQITDMITNVEQAPVRRKAKALGVKEHCIPHRSFSSREDHERALLSCLKECSPFKMIILLGYMRVLSADFLQAARKLWPDCTLINLHPAPLSLYKGAHGLVHALQMHAPLWGVSAHEVTPVLDSGPLLSFRTLPVFPTDTFERLRERAHPLEVCVVLEAIDHISRRFSR